ncbi:hypothetical protein TG4357_02722 [Thalassovita gelatinovora]|uniref:Uncharacterized protein n=1 Tax=Thalassovita gelatinovora TaxID=53501 RepID=A0A0P1FFX6_THAGE|nr:hypothetical protein TG4357_02722 [Thalassovita gelatinovora]SEQ45290.1 hypothetical protein SAMN04488043_105259 [Thalassovita gelatinovora]
MKLAFILTLTLLIAGLGMLTAKVEQARALARAPKVKGAK